MHTKNRKHVSLVPAVVKVAAVPPPTDQASAAGSVAANSLLTEIRDEYKARQLVGDTLAGFDQQHFDLQRTTVTAWAAGVASNGVVAAVAVTAFDTHTKADGQISAQAEALRSMAKLLDARLEYHQKQNPDVVAGVLRQSIDDLQKVRKTQDQAGKGMDSQLAWLLEELNKVAPAAKP